MTPLLSLTPEHHHIWEGIKAKTGRNSLGQVSGHFLLYSNGACDSFCYLLQNCAPKFGLRHTIALLNVLPPPVVPAHFPTWAPFLSQLGTLGACWRI